MAFKLFARHVVGPLQCNCYVVGDDVTKEAIVIDPGGDAGAIAESLSADALRVTAIVATHAHFDHLIAGQELRELTGAPFHLHDKDRPLLEWWSESGRLFLGIELPPPPRVDAAIDERDTLQAGSVSLEVLHTPGHSPGSISLVGDGAVFSGDTLFARSVGRTDLPGGDTRALVDAVRNKLFALPPETAVLPGHGPATTLGDERKLNPFVGESAL